MKKYSLISIILAVMSISLLATACVDDDNGKRYRLEKEDLMIIEDWCRNVDSCGLLNIQDYRCMNRLRNELEDIGTDHSMDEGCRLLFIDLKRKTYEIQNDLFSEYSCDAYRSEAEMPANVKAQIDAYVEPVTTALISTECVKLRQ